MIKEATASVFAFSCADVWRVALIAHPRLGEWLPPGGHVEVDETAAEAAMREVGEETGLAVRLLAGPMLPIPAGYPHASVQAPWWIVEMAAGADGHTDVPHVHVDHVFVAVVDAIASVGRSEHQVRWFTEVEIASVDGIADDSRLQAKELFARIDEMSETHAQ